MKRFIDPRHASPPGLFERQMRSLMCRRRGVSMSGVVQMLRRGESPWTGTAVILFNDAYRDSAAVLAPVLRRYGLPATLYCSNAEAREAVALCGFECAALTGRTQLVRGHAGRFALLRKRARR